MPNVNRTFQSEASPSAKGVNDGDAYTDWLRWQSEMISGVIQGALFLRPDYKAPRAVWPGKNKTDKVLIQAVSETLSANTPIKLSKQPYGSNQQRLCDVIAVPIMLDGEAIACVVFTLSIRSGEQLDAVTQLVQWGINWLVTLIKQENKDNDKRHIFIHQLSQSVSIQPSLATACIETVNRLEKSTQCTRVSIGLINNLKARIYAVSNTPEFDKRSKLIEITENAMDEAIDQNCQMLFPSSSSVISIHDRAHKELNDFSNSAHILTIPLTFNGERLGAVLFERNEDIPFDETTIEFLNLLLGSISTTLVHKQRLENPIHRNFLELFKLSNINFFTGEISKFKIAAVTIALTIICSIFISIPYTISSPSKIEGANRQLIAAPMNGYIKTAHVKVGDTIRRGEPLAILDDQRLRIERQRYISERQQISHKLKTAIAKQDRTQIAKLNAQTTQVNSDLKLADIQLARTSLDAPMSGVVLSGDLSESLGSPVELGQILYEIAPLEEYRIMIEVPEDDIAYVKKGQTGILKVTALPRNKFEFEVERISPLASSNTNGNYFSVEATIPDTTTELLPGMSGVAKIESDEKSLWWILTHKLINKLAIVSWSLGLS